MLKKFLVLLVLVLFTTGCQYFATEDQSTLTGEVIEIPPVGDTGDLVVTDNETTPEENITGEEVMNETDVPEDMVVVEGEEGEVIELQADAYDPDGDPIQYTYSEPFNEEGKWATQEGDAGEYVVTITASDGELSASEDVLVRVTPTNKAPIIDCPEDLSFMEGETVKLNCEISDPEGSVLEIEYTGWMNSSEKDTGFEDAGEYEVTISASDGDRTTTKTLDVEVKNKNRVPIVEDINDITVEETEAITIDVAAEDADGDDLTYRYSEPFNEDGEWQTAFGDTGTYEAYVVVSDGTAVTRSEFTVTVQQKNTAPSLEFIEPITVDEGEEITLPINAFDREGDDLEVTIEGFMDSRTYTTTYEDAGQHNVTVTVSDGELSTSQTVEITVNNVNRPPVFNLR